LPAIHEYVRETRRLEGLPSSTETTFYPELKVLLNAVLKSERLPFDVITGTSEGGGFHPCGSCCEGPGQGLGSVRVGLRKV
jgi:hypothetical protein